MPTTPIRIHWFRNDLRVHDNEALGIEDGVPLVPLFILDPRRLSDHRLGFSLLGPHRLRFLTQSLQGLRASLRDRGSDLIVRVGAAEDVFADIARQYDIRSITMPAQYTWYEKVETARVERAIGVTPCGMHTTSLVHPGDLPFEVGETPFIFTQFRKRIETARAWRPPVPDPAALPGVPPDLRGEDWPDDWPQLPVTDMDERTAIPFDGGEAAGLDRLEDYVSSDRVARYKYTRNQMVGADYSTKFSLWLADGSLSARTVRDRIARYEREVKRNKSTYWVVFELMWRDFFKYQAMRFGRRFFHKRGLRGIDRASSGDRDAFDRWRSGQTGDDFVDANMIELDRTGFMSNRGRQNAASYLVHDLGVDWRWGAYWFQNRLIDFDVHSNWGNWMYVAGVGNDPRTDRTFNTRWQAQKYDARRIFRDRWLDSVGSA